MTFSSTNAATIHDRVFENQAFPASGLNLVVNSIIYWNTIYLSRAVHHLRSGGHDIPDHLLRHVSPQTREYINLTGIYPWATEPLPSGTFRPLRNPRFAAESAARQSFPDLLMILSELA